MSSSSIFNTNSNTSSSTTGRKRISGILYNYRETMPSERASSMARRLFNKMIIRSPEPSASPDFQKSSSTLSSQQTEETDSKNGNTAPMTLSSLPIELCIKIFDFLTLSERLCARQVSKEFLNLADMIPLTRIGDVVHVSPTIDKYIAKIITNYPNALREAHVPKFAPETGLVVFQKCHKIKKMAVTADTMIILQRAGLGEDEIRDWMSKVGGSLRSLRVSSRCAIKCPAEPMLPFYQAMGSGFLVKLQDFAVDIHKPIDREHDCLDSIIKAISANRDIRQLGIRDYRKEGLNFRVADLPKVIGQLRSLETLVLQNVHITVESLKQILGISDDDDEPQERDQNGMVRSKPSTLYSPLKSLRLEVPEESIGAEHMIAMGNRLPDLEKFYVLNLACEPRMLNIFLDSTPNLKILSLSVTNFMVLPNSDNAWNVLRFPKGLERLLLDGTVEIERVNLAETIQRCRNLSSIVYCGSTGLSDTHMQEIYSYLASKEGRQHATRHITLELVDCPKVDWSSFSGAMDHNIQVLSEISHCIKSGQHDACGGHSPLVVIKTLVDWRANMEVFFRLSHIADLSSVEYLETALDAMRHQKELLSLRWDPARAEDRLTPPEPTTTDWDLERNENDPTSEDYKIHMKFMNNLGRDLVKYTTWMVEKFQLDELSPW